MPPILRRTVLGATTLLVCLGLFLSVGAYERQTYNLTLAHPETSTDADGRLVVTMMAKGDLGGVVTLALQRNAAGTVTGGEWALMVSYTEVIPVDPNAPPHTHGEEGGSSEPHAGEALVQKGALKGTIAGGSLTLNPDGSVASLNDLVLSITGGTMQYEATTSGSGIVSAGQLSNRDAATGAVSLIF